MPFYDALVVGGGMIGSAALRHLTLTKPHLRLGAVAPSEPQDWAHHEGVFSSHYDEGRITRMLDPDDVWSRLAEESIGRYGSIEDFSGVSFFNESGFVAVGRDEEGSWLRQVKDSSERRNVSRKILSGEEARSRFYPIHFPDEATVLYQKERAGHISPRKFVRASLKASEKRGADLIDEDAEAVSASASWDEEAGKGWENPSVDGEGVGASESDGRLWDVLLKNGTVVRARRVLVSTGAFTNPRLLNGLSLPLDVQGRTVVLKEVSRLVERVPSLPALPSLITAIRPGRAGREKYDVYGLPPIEYGDGGLWMKLGNGDFPMPLRSVEEVKEWFRGGPSSVYEESILEIFRELYPQRDEETGAFLIDSCPHKAVNCALTFTPTRYPFIDEVPGTSGRLVFAVGGCGGAAKSADELGRLAALRLFGQWDSSYDQDIFAVPGNDGKAVFGMHGNDVRRERDRSRTEEGSETADEKEVREVQA